MPVPEWLEIAARAAQAATPIVTIFAIYVAYRAMKASQKSAHTATTVAEENRAKNRAKFDVFLKPVPVRGSLLLMVTIKHIKGPEVKIEKARLYFGDAADAAFCDLALADRTEDQLRLPVRLNLHDEVRFKPFVENDIGRGQKVEVDALMDSEDVRRIAHVQVVTSRHDHRLPVNWKK